MQVLPPAAAPQGPAANQWTQPPGAQKCAHAPNGHGTSRPVCSTWTNTHHSKNSLTDTVTQQQQLQQLLVALIFTSFLIVAEKK